MKKILLSIGTIAVVGAIVAGGTIAFYNDTETSNGNIFVAGSIDLKVDHTAQTYNGVDCKTCSVTALSDTSNTVIAKNGVPITPTNAVILTPTHPAWTADVDGTVNDARWIWITNPVAQADTTVDTTYTFQKTFTWMGPISGATINFAVATDNSYEVFLNGNPIAADTSENNFSSADTVVTVNVSNNIIQGTNILQFKVKNWAQSGGNPQSNPAGLLYKLTINGNCGDAYFQNHCELWQSQDLTGNEQFFNFDDVKPGDYGTNVISLNVSSNDAYACLLTSNVNNQENLIIDPEANAGDVTTLLGELSQFLKVFAWNDTDNDGVYEGEAQLLPVNTPFLDTELLQLSLTGGGPTKYVGLAWCAGTQSLSGNTVLCNGSSMGDIAQTDSLSASLTAYAEQTRNNPNFDCENVNLEPL
ncbi:MAG: TasA family protein [Candidatus Paceibacterota bacterium]